MQQFGIYTRTEKFALVSQRTTGIFVKRSDTTHGEFMTCTNVSMLLNLNELVFPKAECTEMVRHVSMLLRQKLCTVSPFHFSLFNLQ